VGLAQRLGDVRYALLTDHRSGFGVAVVLMTEMSYFKAMLSNIGMKTV